MLKLLWIYRLNSLKIFIVVFHQNLNIKYPIVFIHLVQKVKNVLTSFSFSKTENPDRFRIVLNLDPIIFRIISDPNFIRIINVISDPFLLESLDRVQNRLGRRRNDQHDGGVSVLQLQSLKCWNWNQPDFLNEGLFAHIYSLIWQISFFKTTSSE